MNKCSFPTAIAYVYGDVGFFFKDNGNVLLIGGRRLFLRVTRGLGVESCFRSVMCTALRHGEKEGGKRKE